MRFFIHIFITSILTINFTACGQKVSDQSSATEPNNNAWFTNFNEAKAKAIKEQKPMLIDFTGSDWCGWCIKLDEEVFSQADFQEFASASLVLVEIDFPKNKVQSDELKVQNKALAEKYSIRGFPTILLLSPEAELIEKTGYQSGGAKAYVSHIQSILNTAN
jgi:thioredoxin-related protein